MSQAPRGVATAAHTAAAVAVAACWWGGLDVDSGTSGGGAAARPVVWGGQRATAAEAASGEVHVMPAEFDLGRPLTPSALDAIRLALRRHGAIAFRGQHGFIPELHRALAVALGDGVAAAEGGVLHSTLFKSTEDPHLQGLIRFSRASHPTFGYDWHSDMSFDVSPSFATILYAENVQDGGGSESAADAGRVGRGETLIADTRAALASLDEAARARAERTVCLHSYRVVDDVNRDDACRRDARWEAAYSAWTQFDAAHRERLVNGTTPVRHPLVRRQPGTGEKCLYPGSYFGVVAEDGDGAGYSHGAAVGGASGASRCRGWAAVADLMDVATGPRFVRAHRWRTGDVLIWDNVCTLHRALPAPAGSVRRMRRTSSIGPRSAVP